MMPSKTPIQLNGSPWHETVEFISLHMTQLNARSQLLKQVFRYGDTRVHLDDGGVATVIDRPMMRYLLSRHFEFFDLTAKGLKHEKSPPLDIVDHLLCSYPWHISNPNDERELIVEAVYRAPVILPDGTLLDQVGYDAGSGLVLKFNDDLKVPSISRSPSRDEARGALDVLRDWLADFPFEDPGSAANALGFMLTPTLRPLMGPRALVPLFIVDAPMAGSGKGLLVDLVAMIASGNEAKTVVADADREEHRKRITVFLRNAPTILHYDNLDRTFDSGAVASMLTSRGSSLERILGSSDGVDQPVRTVFCLSGNNVRVGGDMPRRIVHIRLNVGLEHPAQRKANVFKRPNLLEDARHERGYLLAQILTVGRYVAQHRDDIQVQELPALGSFEAFNATIGGALQLLGVAGWLQNRETFEAFQHEDVGEWALFLTAIKVWQDSQEQSTWTARDLVDEYHRPKKVNPLVAAWPTSLIPYTPDQDTRLPKRLGEELNRRRDQVQGMLAIVRTGFRRSHSVAWTIAVVAAATAPVAGTEQDVPAVVVPVSSSNHASEGSEGSPAPRTRAREKKAPAGKAGNSSRVRARKVELPAVPAQPEIELKTGPISEGTLADVPAPAKNGRTHKVKDTTVRMTVFEDDDV